MALAYPGGGLPGVVEYIGWYNSTRLRSTLGYRSPAEFENDHLETVSK